MTAIDSIVREVRLSSSQALANIRKRLLAPLGAKYVGYQNRMDIYDISFWQSISPIDTQAGSEFVRNFPSSRSTGMDVEFPSPHFVEDQSESCLGQHGVRPISFSFPRLADRGNRRNFVISPVVPGEPYKFDDAETYYQQYRESNYAISHRKAGWDCFRHVEILASGCIPLMLDADQIPECSMVHYPKKTLAAVVALARETGELPSTRLQDKFADWFDANLTSEAMAHYILKAASASGAERVLFVDQLLPFQPDYQSMLTLIGLKQVLGAHCEVLFPVDYLYRDWKGDANKKYGRGFGYTRVLEPHLRTRREMGWGSKSHILRQLRQGSFDLIVVGSLARNGPLAHELLKVQPADRTVWIHGEDQSPSPREMHFIRESGTHAFVRAVPELY